MPHSKVKSETMFSSWPCATSEECAKIAVAWATLKRNLRHSPFIVLSTTAKARRCSRTANMATICSNSAGKAMMTTVPWRPSSGSDFARRTARRSKVCMAIAK